MRRVKSGGFGLRLFVLLLPVIAIAALAIPLRAEESQNRPSGFSLRKTRLFLGGHAGASFPRAGSDLFSMITRELTLEKGDFRGPLFGFDFGVPFHSRFAVVFSFEYGRTSPDSESRNFVEQNGDPIRQTTRLSQMPITATFRFYPRKFGETAGSYAWIPRRILPYVGGGGGVVHYDFRQSGDFVNSQTLIIFSDNLHKSGFARTEHIAAGMDISLSSLIFVNAEARYSWAKADLNPNHNPFADFRDFQPIDLAGLRVIGGIYFRF